MISDKKMTLIEHLGELRSRIIKSAAAVFLASTAVYSFSEKMISHLAKPVGRFVFITPYEAFLTKIKIALFGGVFLASPFVIYQIWQFVRAGLKPDEKTRAVLFGYSSFLFFITGALFSYFAVVPIGVRFLLAFGSERVAPMISIDSYVSFVGIMTLAFGAVFELPLVMLFLTKLGIVTPRLFSSKRREAIVLLFIVAAILTPPDVVSQCLMAIPLLVLYEIGIVFSKIAHRRAKRAPETPS